MFFETLSNVICWNLLECIIFESVILEGFQVSINGNKMKCCSNTTMECDSIYLTDEKQKHSSNQKIRTERQKINKQ